MTKKGFCLARASMEAYVDAGRVAERNELERVAWEVW